MTLIYNRRLSDLVPHTIIGYHGDGYIFDMTDFKVRTDEDEENSQYIGLEIEISRPNTITDNMIEKMMEICPFIQVSNDGSIPGNYTCELQVAPMSINAIKSEESGLFKLLEYLRTHNFQASAVTNLDTGSGCGGHIHISKGDKWEDIVSLMAMFIDQNKEIVQIICKRPFTSYAYNNLNRLGKSIKRYSLDSVKEHLMDHSYDHSNALNLQHDATIEFRLPVGTLNTETKMAHIEFITNLYKCCEDVINGNARLDRLTINKVCQDGEYLPNYMRKLCISCSKSLIVMDREIKRKAMAFNSNKAKLIKILTTLQCELVTNRDNEIRQGSINTINDRLNELVIATTLDEAIRYVKAMKNANSISDGLETYTLTHNNNITKYYNQLKSLVNDINVDDIYYDILEEV